MCWRLFRWVCKCEKETLDSSKNVTLLVFLLLLSSKTFGPWENIVNASGHSFISKTKGLIHWLLSTILMKRSFRRRTSMVFLELDTFSLRGILFCGWGTFTLHFFDQNNFNAKFLSPCQKCYNDRFFSRVSWQEIYMAPREGWSLNWSSCLLPPFLFRPLQAMIWSNQNFMADLLMKKLTYFNIHLLKTVEDKFLMICGRPR